MNRSKKIQRKIDDDLLRDFRSVSNGARDQLSRPARQYMDAIVSPETAKPCGIPTLLGGEPGLTGKMKLKVRGTVHTGTAGFGFIGLAGYGNGFYENRAIGLYSDQTYAAGTVPSSTATAGVNGILFTESPYTAAAAATDQDIVSWRLVGLSVSIMPRGSALSQDGSICLLETPNHRNVVGLTYTALATYRNAREISGIKFGDQKDKIVLNYHPRGVDQNPFEFTFQTTANSSPAVISPDAIIAISATAGLTFQFEVFAIYECRGFKVNNAKATFVDSRGMDLAMNVFRQKKLSGWLGQTHHAVEAYNHALVKAREEENPDHQKWSKLWKQAKSLWGFAREIGGF